MLFGRTEEINRLNEYYDGTGNSLVMLYGRSNIGKTALIRERKLFIISQLLLLKRSRLNFLLKI